MQEQTEIIKLIDKLDKYKKLSKILQNIVTYFCNLILNRIYGSNEKGIR